MNQQEDKRTYTFEELLNTQGYIVYTNVGDSMMPLLRQQKDVIEIHKKDGRVKKYDVVLYKRNNKYILHRCVAVYPSGYVFAGDHNSLKENDVTDEMILGVMTKIIRNGKSIYPSSFIYRVYSHLWVDFFPVKVFLLRAKALFPRLLRVTPSKLNNYLNWKIVYLIDAFNDRRITGMNLIKNSSDHECLSNERISYRPPRYLVLKEIFSHIKIEPSDSFLDIGCGKGRVLAFLISQHCPCQLNGIESNELLGRTAVEWAKKYKNIQIDFMDTFEVDYNQHTILFLNQSFFPDSFYGFIQLLENQLSHSIIMICLFDYASSSYLDDREGWSLLFRKDFTKIYRLQVVDSVKRYSIWRYSPACL